MFTEQGECVSCGGGQQEHTWDPSSGLVSCSGKEWSMVLCPQAFKDEALEARKAMDVPDDDIQLFVMDDKQYGYFCREPGPVKVVATKLSDEPLRISFKLAPKGEE